ncbi:MAG: DNA-directed RNA polymerase subunit beta' [Planctomycetes bacterium]|nr:DNA-directed RNA polymerase subunit beta' [Planctomycetota bacterium]
MDVNYDKINEFTTATIRLASPEEIKTWSYGEIKKPETINYRTYRPERDGLFCERIFGPEKDWECFCGKYKGIKYKGVICDRCGVEITESRVRRKRMGHIKLATPVAHIWFFKIMPSPMGTLLDMKTSELERVIYYQDFVVTTIKTKNCPLKVGQLLTEDQVNEYKERFPDGFTVDIGAKAIKALLHNMDLNEVKNELEKQLKKTSSWQKSNEITKRLKLVEMFLSSNNKPDWMVLEVIPVIPPDLRPLVQLESGNFATSDLNDLYRRLINRNNRLKRLMELNAPEVIIRNEKRMLQQSVDALFDNERSRRQVLDSNGRPLKSLTDMIKGKQGRFRGNLLGKRVDYSARSVIVVGPELKLNQCGLPKRIALELYQPFIIRRLKELGVADTIKSAKKMVEQRADEIWDVLEQVIKNHPVMLNRAPTLHRMGIQAFDPVLVEGNSIRLHPLVCGGFNADFDGDQMAVHLPLSVEAILETQLLIHSTQNIFSPAHGNPIITPTQDIIMGVHYLTTERHEEPGEGKVFGSPDEVSLAYDRNIISLHALIEVKLPGNKEVVTKSGTTQSKFGRYRTTLGRIIFNSVLPKEMPFYNYSLDKKGVSQIVNRCHKKLGKMETLKILDGIKELGFHYATIGGLSICKDDLKVPEEKGKIIQDAEKTIDKIEQNYRNGIITTGERYNQIIDCWTFARERVADAMIKGLKDDTRFGKKYFNPLYLMVFSGARGSIDQVRQLAGMRGLMAKPSGEIIETPIKSNFREGLSVLEYFSSTHGARKGLADTALKTANAGYLTRKLVDVSQNVVVTMKDCGTLKGVPKSVIYKGEKIEVPLSQSIMGRVSRHNIVDVITDEVVVEENELITEHIVARIEELGLPKIQVRSPLVCEAPLGMCAKCYGMDLSTGKLVEEGLAVGIVAAQSIGEPGTQLTMRTFHIGGTASRTIEESQIISKNEGNVRFNNVKIATNLKNEMVVVNRNGEIILVDNKERELERYIIPPGAVLNVKENQKIKAQMVLANWDPHNVPIIAEKGGSVRYEDVVKNVTMKEEVDVKSNVKSKVIIEHKGELHPQIIIEDEKGNILGVYAIPEKAHLEVDEGEKIETGTLLAKTPRGLGGTQDITGGLPRITELFEARRPKEPAIVAEIDGLIELGQRKGGKRTIVVKDPETAMEKEHLVPPGKHLIVHSGDRVRAGDPLVEGPRVLQDILRINGLEALQEYMLREVQNVYRSQNVTINDKHIELIVAQMLRKVRISTGGDTEFITGEIVDKFKFAEENQAGIKKSKKPASAKPLLLGITKASLQSDSFIAAASFQETTRVLTEAALGGRKDLLRGLKENVILGHIVPCGTGFRKNLDIELQKSDSESILNIDSDKKAV